MLQDKPQQTARRQTKEIHTNGNMEKENVIEEMQVVFMIETRHNLLSSRPVPAHQNR